MKNNTPIFRGIATALITPLTADGIDYAQFGKLIDWQIDQGINALVICGTTGESSTLSDAEHRRAIAFACEKVNGRVPVIAGTGSNETAYAVELTKSACADGAMPSWWSPPTTTRPPRTAWWPCTTPSPTPAPSR